MALWQREEYGDLANQVCWTLFALTAVVVILRLICRVCFARGSLGRLGLDDFITAFCVLILLITCILITIGVGYGLGRRQHTLTDYQVRNAVKWNVIINSVLIWTFSLPKFAIIAILKRILDYGSKTTIVFWTLAISSQACILATSVWWFAQCQPVAYQWDRTIPGGKCAPITALSTLGYFTSAYSALLDLFFALYPIPFVMRLNMALKPRIAVCTALGLSSLACVVSLYKLAIFNSVFKVLATDLTYPVPYLDILGIAEGAILIICASLPTLGPLWRLARGKLTSFNGSSRSGHNQGGSSNNQSGSNGAIITWTNWPNSNRGHKLDEEADIRPKSGIPPSVDDIPLVSTSSRMAGARYCSDGDFDAATSTRTESIHNDTTPVGSSSGRRPGARDCV